MGRVAGVLDDPRGFPYTSPGVDVLEGGKLTSNNEASSSHDPLQSFAVDSGAVSKPGGDAAGQAEDAGAHSKLPQLSQEEEALMCGPGEIQLHRDLFSPRVCSFATSVAGTMVLNAEL